jgi:hypothetical protein
MSDVDPTRIDLPATPEGGEATRVHETLPGYGAGEPPGGGLPPRVPDPAPDRRPWIIAALLALIVLILILILVFQDDDDDDADAGSTTSIATTTTLPSTTTEPSTTTTGATTTSTSPVVTVPPAECAGFGENGAQPGLASDTVHEAWMRGDKACAATLMTPGALAELFARPGAGAQEEFQGCTEVEQPDPHADCAYTFDGGSTHYLMNFSAIEGWKVFDVQQVAD